MNEQLQNALADILIKATETAEKAGEFVLTELPDVVQQLLWWKFAESVLLTLIGFAVLPAVFFVRRKYSEDSSFDEVFFWIVASMPCVVAVILIFHLGWLQILIAPKVYLIEYAAELVR